MPVEKFRTIDEMNAAPITVAGESDIDRSFVTARATGRSRRAVIRVACSSFETSKKPKRRVSARHKARLNDGITRNGARPSG
jgi:hypothetical protein